ncbi:UDP-3-O-(3-hydroxymyristoyl)glucosamine N-acyltransferase [bacterium]|nr:UDP-3-O-(3-hydroxymyristoyl)glucosamine N-acyltransferase [bacterium]
MFTLQSIAELVDGELVGPPDMIINGVSKIEEGKEGSISFLANTKYVKHLENTGASAVIIPLDVEVPTQLPVIRCKNSYFAFMQTIRMFFPVRPFIPAGVHASAIIGEGTDLGRGAAVGAHVVIGSNCSIGANTQILPNTVVGDGVKIGDDCIIHANVSLREAVILGDRVVIYDGTVIGCDGFGFVPHNGAYHKIPQIGTVVIEDDVEIGANVTIDRATMGETRILCGTKLDNLIQVAHNCSIGPHTVIAAQTGLSGSTNIKGWCRVGGQVGFAGHISIGDNVAIMAQSGVSKSLKDNEVVVGSPAGPHRQEMRLDAAKRQLPKALKDIKEIKAKLDDLSASRSVGS